MFEPKAFSSKPELCSAKSLHWLQPCAKTSTEKTKNRAKRRNNLCIQDVFTKLQQYRIFGS